MSISVSQLPVVNPWLGRITRAIAAVVMTASAIAILTHQPVATASLTALGYPVHTMTVVGILELACVALYAMPKTRVAGAIVMTGYLGGAVASHVRVGEAFWLPLLVAALVWLGALRRDEP